MTCTTCASDPAVAIENFNRNGARPNYGGFCGSCRNVIDAAIPPVMESTQQLPPAHRRNLLSSHPAKDAA